MSERNLQVGDNVYVKAMVSQEIEARDSHVCVAVGSAEVYVPRAALAATEEAGERATAWQPMETAPKDGSAILARGNNFGDKTKGRHAVKARWTDRGWGSVEEIGDGKPSEIYLHLTEWRPAAPMEGKGDE